MFVRGCLGDLPYMHMWKNMRICATKFVWNIKRVVVLAAVIKSRSSIAVV